MQNLQETVAQKTLADITEHLTPCELAELGKWRPTFARKIEAGITLISALQSSATQIKVIEHFYCDGTTHVRVETGQFLSWFRVSGCLTPAQAIEWLSPLIEQSIAEVL